MAFIFGRRLVFGEHGIRNRIQRS